jgi:flagellar M-ring protein FliF
MDFLNKAFAQFSDLFRSMTPGGRITAGLLLVVAVASVGYLFQHQVNGGDDYLFGGESIPTPTLQKMEEAFGKAGLNGFTMEGGRVKVSHAQRAAYLAALADAKALPPNFGDKLREAGDGGIWESPKQREQRQNQARQDEMSLVISSMKGIGKALVLVDVQPQPGFGLTPLKTASVAVEAVGGVPLDEDQVDKIRYFVAAANAGMKPENVTIADANGRIYPGGEADRGGPDGDPYARAVRTAEHALTTKVRDALSYIPNITVTSAVTLDREKGTRSVEIKNDPKPVPVRTSENNRTMNRESASAGGSPGIQAQGGGANQPATLGANGGKGTNETNEETKNEQVNVVSSVSTEKETFGLTPKLAKVSVGIPASYYEKVWQGRNPAKEGEEAKKPDQAAIDKIKEEISQDVRNAVATLLPTAPEVKDPTTLVTVTTFQDIKAAEIPTPAATQRALTWLGQNWPMVAMLGLVLFSLRMLRSMLRSVPASAGESAAVSMRVTAAEPKSEKSEEPVEATAARRLRRMTGTGPSLRDELSDLVKEDPDSAANILRTWIGQAN